MIGKGLYVDGQGAVLMGIARGTSIGSRFNGSHSSTLNIPRENKDGKVFWRGRDHGVKFRGYETH